jgi:hypothetical protein
MKFFKYILVSGFMVTALGNCAHASEGLCEVVKELRQTFSGIMFWSAGVAENVTNGTTNAGRSTVMVSQHVASYAVDTAAGLAIFAINRGTCGATQVIDLAKGSALRLKSPEQRILDILQDRKQMRLVEKHLDEQRGFSQQLFEDAMAVVAKRSEIE